VINKTGQLVRHQLAFSMPRIKREISLCWDGLVVQSTKSLGGLGSADDAKKHHQGECFRQLVKKTTKQNQAEFSKSGKCCDLDNFLSKCGFGTQFAF